MQLGFAHVSIVVPDIEAAARVLQEKYGLATGERKLNEQQGVRLAYVDLGGAKIELMEPSRPDSPVAKFLERNPRGGIHHFCLSVDDVDSASREFAAKGRPRAGRRHAAVQRRGRTHRLHPSARFPRRSGGARRASANRSQQRMKNDYLGVAVIGAGRIGTLRARLAAKHPAVRYVAISDADPARAKALAEQAGADVHSGDNDDDHCAAGSDCGLRVDAGRRARRGRCARRWSSASRCWSRSRSRCRSRMPTPSSRRLKRTGGDLRIGYSRRYKECFLRAKEQMVQGRLGRVVGGLARVYNSRAQAFAILKRDPHATPVLDVLTYYVDLMCWFLEGNRPVEVVARGQTGIFREAGYGAHDVTWAIVTFADGAVINFGVSYALPARYPTLGQSDRVELLGSDGTMIIDDDHMDHLLVFGQGHSARLRAGPSRQHGVPRQQHGGRLGGRRFLGPARQRDPRLARLSRDRPADRAHDAGAGAVNLETTIAIERAVATRQGRSSCRSRIDAAPATTRISNSPPSPPRGSAPACPQCTWRIPPANW